VVIWVVVLAESHGLAEFGRILWPGRIWQNSMAWQNLVEFHGLAEFGRILWPSRILWPGRIWQKRQIAVNCGKLRFYAQSLLAESVEIGSRVLWVCFIILY
jgi:hypothetical protein